MFVAQATPFSCFPQPCVRHTDTYALTGAQAGSSAVQAVSDGSSATAQQILGLALLLLAWTANNVGQTAFPHFCSRSTGVQAARPLRVPRLVYGLSQPRTSDGGTFVLGTTRASKWPSESRSPREDRRFRGTVDMSLRGSFASACHDV